MLVLALSDTITATQTEQQSTWLAKIIKMKQPVSINYYYLPNQCSIISHVIL